MAPHTISLLMPVSSNSGKKKADHDNLENSVSGPHILVVDKDFEMCQAIKKALSQVAAKVSIALDGNSAIAIAQVREPDLIVLDLQIPKRSGLLVLEYLAVNVENPVPVIVMASNEGNRHQQYAELLGASDYIMKPFTMERLIASTRDLLSQN